MEMQLVIDIGNTAIKWGVYQGRELLQRGAGYTSIEDAINHYSAIKNCMICRVRDSHEITQLLDRHHISYTVLNYKTPLPIANAYTTPNTLGTDRLALAVAGSALSEIDTALIIAAGTCITYNLVHRHSYIGGAISLGIAMRLEALHHYTARLPLVSWEAHRHQAWDVLTGTDTEQSILAGVLGGLLAEIDGTIDQYRSRYGTLSVFVTGGDMDFLVKNLKNHIFARPDMVLEGLNYILLHGS